VGIGDIEHMDVMRTQVPGAWGNPCREGSTWGITQQPSEPGDEMRLHAMMLATLLRGSGGVEIAEGDIFEPGVKLVSARISSNTSFDFSVGIDGRFPVVFGNGKISGSRRWQRGRENKIF